MMNAAALAAELTRAARGSIGKQARGITAKHLDRAAAIAKADAEVKWPTGTGDSAKSIRARMSNTTGSRGGWRQVGYLFVDGGGAYQETGAGHHPPNPVLGPAVEQITPALEAELGRLLDPFR